MSPYSLWVVRIILLSLCTCCGYAISQVQPDMIEKGFYGMVIGFGLGWLLIAIDEMLKGFSLRAFSAATFGLLLGTIFAWLIDNSQLFIFADSSTRWLIRLGLFLSFGYIGMVLALRSNKEDFSLIIPFVKFVSQNKPQNLIVLDTSVIIDGRINDLVEAGFVDGTLVIPRFVLKELHKIADSSDPVKRTRGQRGLEMLNKLQKSRNIEVKIHEADFYDEPDVDTKLIHLAKNIGAKLYTNDVNLGRIAELQGVPFVNIRQLAQVLKPVLIPGDMFMIKIVREGKEPGQGVGYLNDGTMVVVENASAYIGQQVHVTVTNVIQTGAGVIIFAQMENYNVDIPSYNK